MSKNKIINIKNIQKNELDNFIIKTFKEGTIPLNKKKFDNCFNNNTTDGSTCFAYQFGKGEDDAVMIFFYPFECAIPSRYRKNLSSDDFCNFNIVVLEYQKLLARNIDNIEYLTMLRQHAVERFNINKMAIEYDLYRHYNFLNFDQDYIQEYIDKKGEGSLNKSIETYKQKHEQLIEYIDIKIMSANKSDNTQVSELE